MSHSLTRFIVLPRPRWPQAFRWLVIGGAVVTLACRAHLISQVDRKVAPIFVALIVVSRFLPVARAREKHVTFTAAAAYSASVLLNGVVAGLATLLTYVAGALFFQKGGRGYAAFIGAQYALTCQAAELTMTVLRGGPGLARYPTVTDALAVAAAAVVFVVTNAGIVLLGNLGTRYVRREHAEGVLRAEVVAYGVSFPLAALIVLSYRALGIVTVPGLLALAAACVGAVRMTVENRVLRRQLTAIRALGDSCSYSVRPELPLQTFLSLARDLVDFDRGVVWIASEAGADLRPLAVFPEGAPLPLDSEASHETMVAMALTRQAPIMIENTKVEVRAASGQPPQSWLIFPLSFQGQAIGVTRFVRSAARPFTRVDSGRIAALVPHVSVAFESARIRQQMVRYANLATTDGLTGLINHRRCHEVLRDEYARAARYGRSLAILMVDVDSFKQFNDSYGHPQGDVLLRSVATVLRGSVRISDHVGRYGGEEFLAILPETNAEDARLLAERLCRTVAETPFEATPDRTIQRTVSIGVAAYPEDAADPEALVRLADDALYRAKRAGKNRAFTA